MSFIAPRFAPPERILMGPGPSDVPKRVLSALAAPTLGHLDPEYLKIMDEVRDFLRQVFRTENELTMAVSGTGSAGMEACVVNLLEPGDEAGVCVNGVFGGRMKDVMERTGATVRAIEAPWGETIEPAAVADLFSKHPKIKVFGIVHAETSTGAHQPLEEISKIVHDAGALFLVDAVTSLGGVPLDVDALKIDAIYSGTQKCLSCPPGLAPVSFSNAAVERISARKTKVQSWYLDMSMLKSYWGQERVYHHTAPINMTYALRESLAMVLEEGLEARWARHQQNHLALRAGLEAMGLKYIPKNSLATLNAIHAPDGVDEAALRKRLLNEYGIEIGAGLGPFKGKAIRIGLMGASSSKRHVMLVLTALEEILGVSGGNAAAAKVFAA